jgi:hypothetical protein
MDNILVASEFDTSGFKQSVTELVNSLKSVSTVQDQLQGKFEQTTKQLESVQNELKQTKTELDNVGKGQKGVADNSDALNDKLASLTKQNELLTKQLQTQRTELDATKKKHEDLNKSVTELDATYKKVQDTFGKKVAPNIDLGSLNVLSSKLEEAKAKFKSVFSEKVAANIVDPAALQKLREVFDGAESEFKGFAGLVDTLTKSLLNTEPGTEEFKNLSAAIQAGNVVLKEYSSLYKDATQAVEQSGPKYTSTLTRMRAMRDELTRLEQAGQDNTEQYKVMQVELAKLTTHYEDVQSEVRILASETKYLDFGLAALRGVAAGFELVTGTLELFGLSSEDAAEAQKKLITVMAIVQALTEFNELLLKRNVIATVGADIATKAYAASQRILTIALGATTVSATTLKAALISTGIGALIVGIGYLISKLIDWSDSNDKVTESQERLKKSMAEEDEFLKGDLAIIDRFTALRIEKLKQRGIKEAGVFAANQEGYLQKLDAYNQRIATLQYQYELASIDDQFAISEKIDAVLEERAKLIEAHELDTEKERTRIAEEGRKKAKAIADQRAKDEKAALDLLSTIRRELALRDLDAEQKELKELQFEYQKQRAVLVKGHESTLLLEELYGKKRLDITDKYRKLRADAETELTNELDKLSLQAAEARVANISSEFDRERQQIELEGKKTRESLQEQQTKALDELLSKRTLHLISPEEYTQAVQEVNNKFDTLFDALEVNVSNRLNELGSKILQGTIQKMNDALSIASNNLSANAKSAINTAAQEYVKGVINYETYQKRLTEIADTENRERLNRTKATLTSELQLIEQRLLGKITETERAALELQRSELKKQLETTDAEISQQSATNLKKEKDKHVQHVEDIIKVYSDMVNVISGFLSNLSKAEQTRLDRQIAIQQRRVDYAKEIAAKGNAEYLELEQKRLDELQRKREENARKQLAIDNAVRLSQASVAAVSAIAQAAATGNPFAAIAAGIAVLAAIASAYSFVSSLEAPSAEFFEGTTFVDGEPGRDKVRAKLTRGEAVIPVEQNAKYSDVVQAIYYERVPAHVLNEFVANYPDIHVPGVDYSRLGLATDRELSKGNNNRDITEKLDRTNQIMEAVAEKLANLDNVSIALDSDGFALSLIRKVKANSLKWLS